MKKNAGKRVKVFFFVFFFSNDVYHPEEKEDDVCILYDVYLPALVLLSGVEAVIDSFFFFFLPFSICLVAVVLRFVTVRLRL